MTNNPDKIAAVVAAGIEVVERLSAEVSATPHSAQYLATKREKLGHFSEMSERSLGASENSAETPVSARAEASEDIQQTMTLG
jgi:hypothetical protein